MDGEDGSHTSGRVEGDGYDDCTLTINASCTMYVCVEDTPEEATSSINYANLYRNMIIPFIIKRED